MRISGWSSDVCSSDLVEPAERVDRPQDPGAHLQHAGAHAAPELLQPRRAPHSRRPAGLRLRPRVQDRHRTLDAAHPRLPERSPRSEEHTSELQSLMRISYAVIGLKKKK